MKVHTLVTGNMDPKQALQSVVEADPIEVLILYYDEQGALRMRSSKMSNSSALWMLECAKIGTLKEIIRGE